ncbi:DNA-3-methyladenine glycosylase I [Gemmobacter fulvus]|uniref:DNA-3-methyladenine glycosylase I n=1 Tax=Gemmobacter fulvus TaxID=2840474 RepID=A0A975S0G2_9RHOB|nr:DNA-3-methyladenine glycosylase I [Gemmobacter fulvus]MBT9245598.1 DNA-3-methyladenine glycosylase I [Gemmobacter fulvus]MDQ1847187.1 DNA-3-methyladenine glycosylase I [Gemmobacter fulvus]QWK89542.1 DNA-3-methyladenine glycosylase I [Gemmobacter fulvus]
MQDQRCGWCGDDPLYVAYHDTDWGVPEWDGRALWEKLILDGFQAGLSWITILRKRESFRTAFAGFRPEIIATWGEPEVQRLLTDPGIVRHRGKIEATITGAQAYLRIDQREGFAPFLWSFVGGSPVQNRRASMAEVPTQTPESVAMSKALKAEGFKFCGPTIVYAFMQATGMVNDHMITCPSHARVAALTASRP